MKYKKQLYRSNLLNLGLILVFFFCLGLAWQTWGSPVRAVQTPTSPVSPISSPDTSDTTMSRPTATPIPAPASGGGLFLILIPVVIIVLIGLVGIGVGLWWYNNRRKAEDAERNE